MVPPESATILDWTIFPKGLGFVMPICDEYVAGKPRVTGSTAKRWSALGADIGPSELL